MSEENQPPIPSILSIETHEGEIVTPDDVESTVLASPLSVIPKKKPSPKFIAAVDLGRVVEIISKCDNISPEETIRQLNSMCENGKLLIVPPFGGKMKQS